MRLEEILTTGSERGLERQAICFQGKTLTYGQLVAMSDEVASFLVSVGIRPYDRVVLLLDKSLEAIITIFGVLKAQAVYVPIHFTDPPHRLSQIFEECRPYAVMGHSTRGVLPKESLKRSGANWLVTLEVGPSGTCHLVGEHLSTIPRTEWGLSVSSEPPAYILYSSGSTGQPKGIVHSHASALAFIRWACEEFDISESDRVGNCASLAFDLSIFDIFCTLWRGARLILIPDATVLNPRLLVDIWAEEEVTIWYSTPTVLEMILTYGKLSRYPGFHLRLILFAGEVFAVPYFLRLQEILPKVEKYNLYGPTETNVCTFYRTSHLTSPNLRAIPIGWPCPETQVRIVGEDGQVSDQGELWVCGPTVMLGYVDELLTGEVQSVQVAANCRYREYGTGDIVCRDKGGRLIFLGREDAMLKVRGYRVFPSEIENCLLAYPQVKESAVVPQQLPDGRVELVACMVATEGSSLAEDTLRRHCMERLPSYMVPATFRFVHSLPKTATHKVDRRRIADFIQRKGQRCGGHKRG